MPSNNYKRKIRAVMAAAGVNYMRAKRIVDEQWAKARAEAAETVENGDEGER